MNRKIFLKASISAFAFSFLPEVLRPANVKASKEEKILIPKWIVDKFGNEDQIGVERYYHDSKFLFPELDHTMISVNTSILYPWKLKRVYSAYKGEMYHFVIEDKFKVQRKALVSFFSR